MRPRIKLRPRIHIRPKVRVIPQQALIKTTGPEQMQMLTSLLQRYGVARVRDLPADRLQAFTEELQGVLAGKLPHPADSDRTPFYQRKENLK